ncbi:unnamed protein product [Linum trigynum]|uniref:Wall-associated receptor kinase galacturonan-binding domain-containing protein n=1 Tax=Linum trigynum TaxID=586398 RepID=A0AAV2FHW6_9ROSI
MAIHFHWSLHLYPILISLLTIPAAAVSATARCRTTCGTIPIRYPFGIDDGCGSPYYRRLLLCSFNTLHLRTPSGTYQIKSVSYTDSPHLILTDPSMWACSDGPNFRPTRPFSLDSSTRLTLSRHNDYLFFNCSPARVIMEPKPVFCERFPDRCDSTCDTAGYLCRHLPGCAYALSSRAGGVSCCSYSPKATESLRLMLEYCATYASVYWRNSDSGASNYYGETPEYGVRVDFDIPVTSGCLRCQDMRRGGGGTCGFDTVSREFLCLCRQGNVTTSCEQDHDQQGSSRHSNAGVIVGTVGAVSAAGAVGIGAGVWYFNKIRAKAPVTCGVQSNENRLF